jgi:ABC-2 type transport system ATP-binding protein
MENNNIDHIIEVKELTKKFAHLVAVDKVSFNVKKGEIFGFLGPNGAGKTTTVNMLCTLLLPTSGDALINGFSIKNDPLSVRKSIGIVFQESTLDNHLTVKENLYLHAKLYGLTNAEFNKKFYQIVKLVDLEDKLDSSVGQLSGGTKRRIEIARVLIHEPKILFLDEPTVGLDAQTRNKIWDYLLKIRKESDMTIFLTTQYINEAEVCDRISVIDHGEIIALDTPDNLKNIANKDTIEIQTNDNVKSLEEVKNGFPNIPVKLIGKNIIIKAEKGETFLPKVLEVITEDIISINLTKPSLEDIFLELTGRQIR